jgi:hypothetical protein
VAEPDPFAGADQAAEEEPLPLPLPAPLPRDDDDAGHAPELQMEKPDEQHGPWAFACWQGGEGVRPQITGNQEVKGS